MITTPSQKSKSWTKSELTELIRRRLAETTASFGFEAHSADADLDLYSEGIIDSFDLATLVALIETDTGLQALIRPQSEHEKFVISIDSLARFFIDVETNVGSS